jgi:hypothetical protein
VSGLHSNPFGIWGGDTSRADQSTDMLFDRVFGRRSLPLPSRLSSIIDAEIGSTQGQLLYRNATVWTPLAPGTNLQVLTTAGASANPFWNDPIGTNITPAYLFTKYAPTHGGWYDPTDITTLFQDTAGTNPVTTTGQSIKLMKDKSGLGNDLSQATTANAPTYQVDADGYHYANFSGTQWMDTASTSAWDATTKVMASVAWWASVTGGRLMDHRGTGTSGTVAGWFLLNY